MISFLLFNIFYSKKSYAIYLQDISVFSQYRYLTLFSISFFFIIIFAIAYITGYTVPSTSFFTYPYLKEEVRKFLYSWNDSFIGNLCVKLTNLFDSQLFVQIFFSIHFIFFFLIRLFSTCLLFYCTFYHGNFYNFIYMTFLVGYYLFLIIILFIFNRPVLIIYVL
jgi:hypothetical protein